MGFLGKQGYEIFRYALNDESELGTWKLELGRG